MSLKYIVIGAGGTGGAIGGFLSRSGMDVTLIARGAHLKAMRRSGLRFETPQGSFSVPVKTCSMEDFHETPDVIFICVKGYSLDALLPFLHETAGENTVIIPVLNLYGTGGRLQKKLPGVCVTDGCIYIASQIKEPGVILLSSSIFRVVCGLREDTPDSIVKKITPCLETIQRELTDSGIETRISDRIERDALQKFSFVSPMAAVGAFYNVQAFAVQAKGQMRSTFISLIREIKDISDAMGISLPDNIVDINLRIMDGLAPEATASMQRDLTAGKESEIDGLIFEVIRLGKQYHVPTPVYDMIADKFGRKDDSNG